MLNSIIYTISDILNKAIPFLLLPILTKYLTPNDYGIISLFGIFTSILTILIGLNLNGAISVNYFKLNDRILLSSYVGNAILILFIMTIITIFFISIGSVFFDTKILEIPFYWLVIGVVVALSQVLIMINLTLYQTEQKAKKYVIFELIQVIFNVVLSLILIVGYALSWEGRLIAISITSVFFANISFYILYKYRKMVKFDININYIRDMLKYGVPLLPHSLAGWGKTSIDRLIIISFLGTAELGIYAIAYQMASIINLVFISFNKAWIPYLFEKLKNINSTIKNDLVKFTYIYFFIIIILYIIIYYFINIVFQYFIDSSYSSAATLVPIIMVAFLFEGMYYMVGNYILYEKKTAEISKATLISTIIHVFLAYFTIKYYGLKGLAYTMICSYFINFVLVWYISNKVYPMPWFNLKIKDTNV
ncbi:MAG: oligosaccharide flippase family protein [Sulfurimonas sp.]|uniref:lipopolysaccharide biosynthesis protein n=1 Tax=Sulfurimonas sp. TaxID=2022749 RepID=UPI0025E3A938|nr:oligosaccharide flippase family protein [Sulfurimonas sp.]MCK9491395.1 oligosaccharide flippase family protein [Sulfurimonas sp.]